MKQLYTIRVLYGSAGVYFPNVEAETYLNAINQVFETYELDDDFTSIHVDVQAEREEMEDEKINYKTS